MTLNSEGECQICELTKYTYIHTCVCVCVRLEMAQKRAETCSVAKKQ